jgi:hypothetical protein
MFFFFGEKVLCFHFLARNSMISSGFWGQFRNVGSSWLASHMWDTYIYREEWRFVADCMFMILGSLAVKKIKRMHVMCVPFCLHVKAM